MSSIGTPVVVGIMLVSVFSSFTFISQVNTVATNKVDKAQDIKLDRLNDRLKTNIEIQNTTILNSGSVIYLEIKNTGQTVIHNISKLILLTDVISNYYVKNDSITSDWNYTLLINAINPMYWDPDETLSIYVVLYSSMTIGEHYLVLSTLNGVRDTVQWEYTG